MHRPLSADVLSLPVTGVALLGPDFGDQLASDRSTLVLFLRHHG